MVCPNCQYKNRPTARFCGKCRTRLQRVCAECGAEALPGCQFCDECGADLSSPAAAAETSRPATLEAEFTSLQQSLPQTFREQLLTGSEGENRLVTVLFADMSGSLQRTAALHPEEAAQLMSGLLQAMVDVLLQHGGRVDRFLGDGLLAVFGAPQAHESDAERAILAALAIREAAGKLGLQVTAGINTGEVYVGGIGSERHQEVTVMGPVVHLASRLQGLAEPGQILVGEATYRQTRRAFVFTPATLAVKGIEGPIAVYAVDRPLPRPEKTRGIEGLRAELIGRDEEFAKLQEALAALLQGQGQMITLIGEAGVGKSRLVAELKAVAKPSRDRQGAEPEAALSHDRGLGVALPHDRGSDSAPLLWLEGRCLELSMTASYWPFLDLFRDYFAWAPDESEADRAGRLVAALREMVSRGDLTEARFEEMVPLLGHLLALRFGNDWDERLKNAGPQEIKHRTFTAIRDFFLALARRQPLLLVLEDLHWADSLSLDLISLLMETVTFAPLMLLCIYRPEREHKCWHLSTIADRKCSERYAEITLRELTAAQSRRLIESLLTIENLPVPVKDAIQQKSGGNPFFVEEVVRSLMASGMVYQEGDVWRAKAEIASIAVPDTIQSVILSRVDRLEKELKRVLQSAAVIGRLFRRRLLEYTTREQAALERHLWELEELALIYQERAVPEEEYSFKHVLTQETIYESILRRRRAAFHQQVAEAIEALYAEGLEEQYEQLAYHYERSGVDEKAIEYLLKAGEKAGRAYLNEEAVGYLTGALERIERSREAQHRPKWQLQALQVLGQIHHRRGDEAEAEAAFREAVALGRQIGLPPREQVRLCWWLADVLYWQYRFAEMIAVGEEGLALLGSDDRSAEAALMNETLASGYSRMGDAERSGQFARRIQYFIRDLPYSEELRPAFMQVVWLTSSSQSERATWLQALEERAERHHDLKALGQVHQHRADDLGSVGDLRGALSRYEQAVALFAKTGDAKHESSLLLALGSGYLAVGDLERAEARANRGLHAAEGRVRQTLAISYRTMVPLLLARGLWERAAETCHNTIQLHHELGLTGMWPTLMLGRTYLAWGKRCEALEQLQNAMALVQPDSPLLPVVLVENLSSLEEAYDDVRGFQAFCRRFRKLHPWASSRLSVQWSVERAKPHTVCPRREHHQIAVPLSPAWKWNDPFADCAWTASAALEIHAANERELRGLNLSAPRLLRPAAGGFAAEVVCSPAAEDKPAIGGLLLWKDKENYLRLDRGTRGQCEISFQGCVGNADAIFGRGRLASERTFLRLERQSARVRALCSADGEEWFTAGEVEFPVEDPVEVGLHAIGSIDRTIYPGAYPQGTAIRFERFELWV